jgi:hypothetical protein
MKDVSKLQQKPSVLEKEHPALQNMKFLPFFLFLRFIFVLLVPDSTEINADPYGSGSGSGPTTLNISKQL